MPGIESWFEHGAKSKTGRANGMEKVRQVAEHINLVLRHIPFVQTNFVLGLDSDERPEPFELTKRFIDLARAPIRCSTFLPPMAAPRPLNLQLQRADRVLPFPFFFLDGSHAMNVQPLNYEWLDFYSLSADLTRYAFSLSAGTLPTTSADVQLTSDSKFFVSPVASEPRARRPKRSPCGRGPGSWCGRRCCRWSESRAATCAGPAGP